MVTCIWRSQVTQNSSDTLTKKSIYLKAGSPMQGYVFHSQKTQ